MINKIDHIAIAVANLDSALETFSNVLGCAPGTIVVEEVPSENVKVAFIHVGDTKIELLEPLGPDGAIARFLAKNGEGMHHIAFGTDDLTKETERISEFELKPLSPPFEGAGGKKVVFLHPKQTNRVLIELVEPKLHQH